MMASLKLTIHFMEISKGNAFIIVCANGSHTIDTLNPDSNLNAVCTEEENILPSLCLTLARFYGFFHTVFSIVFQSWAKINALFSLSFELLAIVIAFLFSS